MTIEGTTTEFELPFGLEKDGVLHTTVVMRRVRNSDLINVNKDRRVKELKREGHKITVATMNYAENKALHGGAAGMVAAASGQDTSGEVDPVAMQTLEGALAELNAPLLAQVIINIGEIVIIDKGIINSMSPADADCCMRWYQWFNTPPKKREENPDEVDAKEESKKDPSPDSTN